MKKIFLLSAVTVMVSASSMAFAAGVQISSSASTTFGTASPTYFKASAKVMMYGKSEDTKYAVAAQHTASKGNTAKGGRAYNTNNINPAVTEENATANDAPGTCTTDACTYN